MSTADRDARDARHDAPGADAGPAADEVRDELPADLDHASFVGAYQFPDNSRRRIPGAIYVLPEAPRAAREHPDEVRRPHAAQHLHARHDRAAGWGGRGFALADLQGHRSR